MRAYAIVSIAATVMYVAALASMLTSFRSLPTAWRLLGYSGIPLSLGGLGFILRFWNPTPGPYIANSVYPFGSHLSAWAVSFGFMWMAFGLLFTFGCLQAARAATLQAWVMLLISWVLAWLPHVVIGVAFAGFGANRESVAFYRTWGSNPIGFTVLATGAFIMLAHFTLSIAGFLATSFQIARSAQQGPRVA